MHLAPAIAVARFGCALILLATSAAAAEIKVPIVVSKPERVTAATWPVTFGVPFAQGVCADAAKLCVVDSSGKPIAAQITRAGGWDDGSVRWAMVDFQPKFAESYFVTDGRAKAWPDDITIQESSGNIVVNTGAATYTFRAGQGCFDEVKLAGGEMLVRGGGGAFYVIDSKGRRGVLRANQLKVEIAGPRRSVIRIEGEYITEDGTRNAAGVVYFHFYAGLPQCRISHKLIITEETLDLWFRDIGVELPLAFAATDATFNKDHADLGAAHRVSLKDASAAAVMCQQTFPHFGHRESRFTIELTQGGTSTVELEGKAAGEWAEASRGAIALGAQIPALAEQFPKALRVTRDKLIVKLWASESGQDLDYRTEPVIKNYIGHDWIPADHASVKIANTARGLSKTHELWLFPHVKDDKQPERFSATREGVFALPDPAWIGRSAVMGPWAEKDVARWPQVEAAIDDYYTRFILVSQQVFPPNGYIGYGMYPFAAQAWEIKNGQWYPQPHRLSRAQEYNLKRSIWIVAARSADPRFYHYARRYTRFAGDMLISSWDAGTRPKGWLTVGSWHSPIVWGAWDEKTIRAGAKPNALSSMTALTWASSEDVIQFVYDYFLAGDLHSRDSALAYKEAVLKEMNGDVERALKTFFPAVTLLRPMGAAYELDHDPRVLDFTRRLAERMTVDEPFNPQRIANEEVHQNYGKMGEVIAGFYYYYVSTGDQRVRQLLEKYAEHAYRFGTIDNIISRTNKAVPESMAIAYQRTKEPAYAQYLAQWLREFGENADTLARRGLSAEQFNQQSQEGWGQEAKDEQDAIGIGMPVAMAAVRAYEGAAPPAPLAWKPLPTAATRVILRKDKPGPMTLDLLIQNVGDAVEPQPKLFDAANRPASLEVIEHFHHRQLKPRPNAGDEMVAVETIWYGRFESHDFYRVRLPDSLPMGDYILNLGDEVCFIVLAGDVQKIVQAAPDGLVLRHDKRYFFNVGTSVEHLELFAHRAVRLFGPDGSEVKEDDSSNLAAGKLRYPAAGRAGVWSIATDTATRMYTPGDTFDTFVRFSNVAMVVAMGSADRLFAPPPEMLAPAQREDLPKVAADQPFAPGKFGQALIGLNRFVRVPLAEVGAKPDASRFPHSSGTAEFWVRPLWSQTDAPFEKAGVRWQMLSMDPLQVWYTGDQDNRGNTGRYDVGRLQLWLDKASYNQKAIFYPVAGKWYHVAMTWNLDGKNSAMDIFINGRRRAYAHYGAGIPTNLTAEKLIAPASVLKFGSTHAVSNVTGGEIYDELRVSRTIRYTADFTPPAEPFVPDADTYILMHLDGDLTAHVDGRNITGSLTIGARMLP